jgi:hypothetical protein
MKLLYLNSVITVTNQKGEEKVKKALSGNVKKDESSLPKSWYTEQNLKPPIDVEDDELEVDENGMIFLQEDEFDYDFVDCVLRLDDFSSCVDNEKIGSVVYTRDGDEMWVEQTSEEIYAYITVLTRHWTTVLADNIIYYFNFFRRKNKTK